MIEVSKDTLNRVVELLGSYKQDLEHQKTCAAPNFQNHFAHRVGYIENVLNMVTDSMNKGELEE